MASPVHGSNGGRDRDGDDFDDGVLVVLTCAVDGDSVAEMDTVGEIVISTTDVNTWDFSSILGHEVIKVKADKNRLMEQSSYFHGLLSGSFSESDLQVIRIQWHQQTFLSLMAFIFSSAVDVTFNSFLPLLEGALYFGVELLLLKCKVWLTEVLSSNRVSSLQLHDLNNIWKFGSEHVNDYIPELCTCYLAKNFMWARSCNTFNEVHYDLLLACLKHPHLTVYSEKHLCDALIGWVAANAEQRTKDDCVDLLKQIRISLLPLSFAAGKRSCQYFSEYANESISGILTLLKHHSTRHLDVLLCDGLHNLRIRLSEFTEDFMQRIIFWSKKLDYALDLGVLSALEAKLQLKPRVDLSGCPQLEPSILLLSALPNPLNLETLVRKQIEHVWLAQNSSLISWGLWPTLTFDTVQEMDISNCPMLHLEDVIECLSKSFPSLRTLKAAYLLSFRTTKLRQLVKKCPLLCDIDLTVDASPIIPTHVSILSSFPDITESQSSNMSSRTNAFMWPAAFSISSAPLLSKLTLDGRIDVSDSGLLNICDICVSLCYLSIKGCTSLSDAGIAALLLKCVNLQSIVACDTSFGQQSVLSLCSFNCNSDHFAARKGGKDVSQSVAHRLQMLHIGGCKGIKMSTLPELMSQTCMLKSLCLRESPDVDASLYALSSSSLDMLDVSDTKVSAAAVAHIIGRNPGLLCLKTRGCQNLCQHEMKTQGSESSWKEFYIGLGRSCKFEEIEVGWGFSGYSLEALKPAVSLLKAITVGLGGSLGQQGLILLTTTCPLLQSVILYFQVISDHEIKNMLESLKQLEVFALSHCLGEISSLSLRVSMPNLKTLRLERVAPWMSNADLIHLTRNCARLVELSLLGCRLLNPESQRIISSGWPGLISVHLEDCGNMTINGVVSLFDCYGLEDILLRHNGPGIQENFIKDASSRLPMLRKLSLDLCDAKNGNFDLPDFADRYFLSVVKIARCKPQRHTLDLQQMKARKTPVHKESLVLVWDSTRLTRTVVKERV